MDGREGEIQHLLSDFDKGVWEEEGHTLIDQRFANREMIITCAIMEGGHLQMSIGAG